ncbi:MAG: alpha/beta hydrolase family protein [Acidimicrobiales bacterium]
MSEAVVVESAHASLGAHIAKPARAGQRRPALLLVHGLSDDSAGPGRAGTGHSHAVLADRLAAELGWTVASFSFRGVGESSGDFSPDGWLQDLRVMVSYVAEGADGVWLAGFNLGGALAVCVAAEDARVRGVATFGAPADFEELTSNPRALVAQARKTGMIKTPGYGDRPEEWVGEVRGLRVLQLAARLAPRPLLVVHGADDSRVPVMDGRALADAAEAGADLRVLSGAGHRLRHDPRAVALLIGWLERQKR